MSTTFYSPALKDNAGVDCQIRGGCVYNVTESTTSVTVSGTVYLQHKGTKLNGTGASIWGGAVTLTPELIGPYDWSFLTPNRCYQGQYSGRFVVTTTKDSGTYTNHSDWTNIYSKAFSFTVQKGTSAVTLYLVSGLSDNNSNGFVWFGAYKAVSVPALASYNVTYNANGGTGAPATQKKYYGKTLTLSSTTPTRTNYVFKNWNTTSGGTGTTYNPGASYTANAALALYAQWYAPYTVTYNANGGTGGPTTQTKVYNKNLTLTSSTPTRSGYAFVKWNTNSSGTGTSYNPGATYSANASVTLYAVWAAVPSISSLTAIRCDSNGDQDDEGTYANITCVWSCAASASASGAYTPQSGGGATSFSFTSGASGSGTVTSTGIIGGGNLDTDMQYTVSVTISCTSSGTTKTASRNVILTRAFFVMDWKAGGGAVGIGRAAPASGLEVGYAATFDSSITSYGHVYLKDKNLYLDNQTLDTAYNATLSAQTESSVLVNDKNSVAFAAFRGRQLATGEKRAIMEAHGYNSNGDSIWCNFICQVDKNGTRSYSVSDQGAFRNAISAVSRGGDTMTGHLLLKDGTIDRDGANPSSVLWSRAFQLTDKDGERLANYTCSRETDGRTRVGLWAYNEKTDGTEVSNSINVYCAKDGTSTYAVSSATNFRSAIGALGKVPQSAELPHSTATSNVFPLVLGNSFANNGAISYQNPGEFRSTISAAAKTWTSIASTSGTTAKTFTNLSSSGYSEVLIVCSYSTTYRGSVVLNIASISTTETEVYLTGGASGGGGRRACCKLTLTKLTPIQIGIDNVGYNANWTIHAR